MCPNTECFWSVFSRIRTEYGPEKTAYLDTFHAMSAMSGTDWVNRLGEGRWNILIGKKNGKNTSREQKRTESDIWLKKNWVNILVGLKRDRGDLSWGKIRRIIKATSYKYQLIQFDVVELLFNFFYQFINKFLQSWSKYLRQTLVLVWNSGLREKFNFNF